MSSFSKLLATTSLVIFSMTALQITAAQSVSSSSSSSKGKYQYSVHDSNGDGIEIEVRGDVVFLDDDSGIASISDGGSFSYELVDGRTKTYLRISPGNNGNLEYTYRVNGKNVEFDNQARRAFSDQLLDVFRRTGLNAEARVARILRTSGVNGVFEEINHLEGSSVHSRYFTELATQGKLNTEQLVRLVRMTDRISSSGDRSRFFMAASPYYLENTGASAQYFMAIADLPSSGDHSRVLLHALDTRLNNEQLALVLESSRKISSSGDKSRVLIAASSQYTNHPQVRDNFFRSVNSIGSSGDKTRVLMRLVETAQLDAESTESLFQSASNISSDGDKTRLLISTSSHFLSHGAELRNAYFEVVSTISSSGNHSRVLLKLLDSDLDRESLLSVIDSSMEISSSGDKSRVLIAAAPQMTDDGLVEAYLAAAESIGSSGDRSRALSALMKG